MPEWTRLRLSGMQVGGMHLFSDPSAFLYREVDDVREVVSR
jgi:hypothetical protein